MCTARVWPPGVLLTGQGGTGLQRTPPILNMTGRHLLLILMLEGVWRNTASGSAFVSPVKTKGRSRAELLQLRFS